MTTFAITSSDQVIGSVNYLLSNLGQSGNVGNITIPTGTLIGNTTTGVVTPYGTGGNAYSYLYQYVNLRYANNATGSSGFSTVPTNSDYFGVYNSTTQIASSNPTDYQWQQVAGGFGTTKTIYYSSIGGRQILFAAANSAPNPNYQVSTANVAIDLDVVTTAAGTPGERGPVPMAYVITTADPTSASSITLSGWFSSSRTALTPPIGTGLTPPVAGDTAYFTYPTTGVSETYTFNGSAWNGAVGQVVSGNTLVANSTPGNAITSSTITSTQIAANTITATNIQSNTITANQIAANTITATQISTSYLYTGNIISTNGQIGNTSSPGYWLQYNNGDARFGGNVSIGANLNVSGLISTSGLISNTVATTNMVVNSATQVIYQGSTGASPIYGIPYYNNTGNTYWPYDTRGFAIPAVAILPTTTGTPNGSSILLTFSCGVETDATDNPANLVELWRTGQDYTYSQVWNGVTTAVANNIFTGNVNNMVASGTNDYRAFSTDGGNTWSLGSAGSSALNGQQAAVIDWSPTDPADTEITEAYLNGVVTNFPGQDTLGSTWDVPGSPFLYDNKVLFVGKDISDPVPNNDIGILTGGAGYIATYRPLAFGNVDPTSTQIAVPTGVLSDIYSSTFSNAANANAQVKTAVFVGTGGTVLTNQFTFNSGNANVTNTALTLISAVTDSNLYGVSSDLSANVSTAWVAVGESGTIIRSTNSGAAWSTVTSGTVQNLRSVVGYGGDATKRFVAVGDAGTILHSSDAGVTWTAGTVTAPTDGITRDLKSVAFNPTGGTGGAGLWVAVGEGIIYKCDKTSTTWTIAQQTATTVSSQLKRLIFLGSNSNVYDNAPVAVNSIGNSVISYTYQDTDYNSSQTYQYYLVAGNMNSYGSGSGSPGVIVRFPSLTVQEIKR